MLFDALRKPNPKNLLTSPEVFRYFEYAMFCMGWTHSEKFKILYRLMSVFITAWCVIYFPIGIIINLIFDSKSITPKELLNILQLFFNALGTPIKVFFFRIYLWRFYKVKEILYEMDKRCQTEEEQLEVHRWVVRCNKFYLGYQALYTFYSLTSFLSSALTGQLVGIYNPFIDWRKNKQSFWLAASHENALMIFSATHTMMSDIYPLLYGLIMKAHINLLRQRVEKLCKDQEKSDEENQRDLIKCIQDHRLLKQYAELIRPVIDATIFVQFLLIGILLGLSMINLLLFADIWSGLSTAVYIMGLLLQTFPFCYVCDLIQYDCGRLSVAVFHSNWLSSSQKYKGTLRFFLQNSQKSIVFIAGNIFPISTSTNISVAKLAFTVATFLNQLNIGEKLKKDK
ncbi:hypothetical protein KR026_009725 [Drosophila bipectinata]|nr:hypothetical protein KR026_009725 [Drosophila bipectinata]